MSEKTLSNLLVCGLEILVGAVGYGLCCVWWKVSGRDIDRDALSFLGKMWGGIVLFGIVMVFLF